MHQLMAATLDHVVEEIQSIQNDARATRQTCNAARVADDCAAHAQRAGPARR